MVTLQEIVIPRDLEWQQMQEKLHHNHTLAGLVLAAWQIGLWLATALVESELNQRAQPARAWGRCPKCGATLHRKGCVSRRILTLVGWVEWRRRVGRCPNRCSGSQTVPFAKILGIAPYQQTSVALINAAAQAYGKTLPNRTATQWFERLRHQLRHGYVHHILKEFETLLRYASTPASAKTTLQQVRSDLKTHLQHLQYRQFKKLGLPIGSGMVESACKWLITQRIQRNRNALA